MNGQFRRGKGNGMEEKRWTGHKMELKGAGRNNQE